jgi:hypothetical protein
MATYVTKPSVEIFAIGQLLQSRYHVRIKTHIHQSLRAGVAGGVCFALTEKWFETGLLVDETQRREERKKFRTSVTDTLKSEILPPGIQKRQEKYLKDKRDAWPPAPGVQLEELYEKEFAEKSANVHTKIGIKLKYVATGNGKSPGNTLVDQGLWAIELARLLTSRGDSVSSAYFFLDLRHHKSNEHHLIGLKRGKLKTPCHYSLFDANCWEVTQISEDVLAKFLADFSVLLPKYDYWFLNNVTVKEDPFEGWV